MEGLLSVATADAGDCGCVRYCSGVGDGRLLLHLLMASRRRINTDRHRHRQTSRQDRVGQEKMAIGGSAGEEEERRSLASVTSSSSCCSSGEANLINCLLSLCESVVEVDSLGNGAVERRRRDNGGGVGGDVVVVLLAKSLVLLLPRRRVPLPP